MDEATPDPEEYVFRFLLTPEGSGTDDPLTAMLKTFFEGFLEIGCFTHKGRRVTVDGFRLNGRAGTTGITPARPD